MGAKLETPGGERYPRASESAGPVRNQPGQDTALPPSPQAEADNPRLAAALHLAELGFPVFPLYPPAEGDPKQPRIIGWQDKATTDPEQLRAWWQQWPGCNPGILTTDFVVIDVDAEPGRNGYRTLETLQVDALAMAGTTYTQRTPSGGLHIFFNAPYPVRNGVDVLGPGVDIRGRGGLAVGAGAQFPAGTYSGNDMPVANVPAWLFDRLQQAPEKSGTPAETLAGVDTQRAECRAVEYLESLPIATEGGRNVACVAAANRLGDLGVSADEAVGLMAEHFKAEPGLDFDEIEKTVRSAYTSRESAIGWSAPEVQFKPIDHGPAANDGASAVERKRFAIASGQDLLLDYSKRRDLIEDVLPEDGVSMIVGAPKSRKSFLALDMGLHVALGREWHGQRVKPGGVAYIAAEAPSSIRMRVDAWCRHHKVDVNEAPFGVISDAPNLRAHDDTAALIEAIRGFNDTPALVVVDTLNKAFGGGDENSAGDASVFLKRCEEIAAHTGAHVLVIHHLGKDEKKGSRGSTAFGGGVDSTLIVTKKPDFSIAHRAEVKDGQQGAVLTFGLEQVELGNNFYGKPVQGAVVRAVRPAAAEVFSPQPQPKGRQAQTALAKLRALAAESDDNNGHGWILEKDWRHACMGKLSESGELKTEQTAFRRAREQLLDEKFIVVRGDQVMAEIFPPGGPDEAE